MYGYIEKSVFNDHLGSSNDPCYYSKPSYKKTCYKEVDHNFITLLLGC